ncbi:DUF2490 domain-containing protein [Cryomorpha ignava]|uniref:DUF2490 domain-containing protein n=1 Tax=Cryomorpha ignava TaxID=101383 RepID=A0A7K3WL29_9FLAO|nr:DUF2490 domain-containing protein [Cryomorpha ignava]NEN22350.1 DUF2490 domain-containing protein [Cryomorpha ignava]
MNIRIKLLLALLLVTASKTVFAQIPTRVGFLPSINYNHKLNTNWDVNLKYESRHFVYNNNTSESRDFNYNYGLSDFSALVGRKVGLNSKVVAGFLTRIEPDIVVYRTIQQFIFQTKLASFRLAHRIAADQTFSPEENPEFRLRYRVSAEIPLSGLKVDVKEFYIKFNTELLNSLQNDEYDLEFRVVPNIGYVINDQQKIELGLDNRFDSLIDNETRLTSWISINWYL